MMNKSILIFFIGILTVNTVLAQVASDTLTIQINGLKNSNGKVRLQLFDADDGLVAGSSAVIENEKSCFIIPGLKAGKYSIRYFHDENENQKLDTNWLGLPVEGYGFSNNASAMFGPPSLDKRLFNFDKTDTITLTIGY